MRKKVLIAAAALLAAICTLPFLIWRPIAPAHPALAEMQAPLIPLREFYANADARWRFSLSPDGSRLAWLEAKWLKPALWVRPLSGEDAEIFHTDDEVRWYAWSADGRYLLYQADRDGWENDVIVSIDVSAPGAAPRTYDFGADVKSFIYRVPKGGGAKVVIAHNARDRAQFDLFRLDLDSGETEEMAASLGDDVSWSLTREGEIYARRRWVTGDDWRMETPTPGGGWREVARGDMEDWFSFAAAPRPDGTAFAISNRGRDKSAFVAFNMATGAEEVLSERADADLDWLLLHPEDDRPLIAFYAPDRQKRAFLDPEFEASLAPLGLTDKQALHISGGTGDFSKILIEVEEDISGFRTYLLDRETGALSDIATPGIASRRGDLAATEPVFITASDGLRIPAFLTRPLGVESAAPMVIVMHGGPIWRSRWGWSDLTSWLANRGYAVLDVNYRGGSNYGTAFREAAIGEVSRAMHQDIVDARAWAVAEGIADPKKVAVFGGSFGGLKVLTAMTRSPELFAAGIDVNGISDISTMLQEVPVYWTGWPAWYRKYIGDPDDPEDLAEIRDRSPLTHAANVAAPLMIIQGVNDVRVIRDQAERFAAALDEHGVDYDYLEVDGGHTFANWGWKQRIVTMRAMEVFLAKHLGGRADGFDYAVLGGHILP